MKLLWLMAFLMLAALADGEDSALTDAGQMLYYVGGSEAASSEDMSQYQDFYDNNGNNQVDAGPAQYMVSGSEPESLVVGSQSNAFDQSSVPMNSYWIQGSTKWTQYIKCPMYARFKLLAYTEGGIATVREDYPDGTQMKKDFQFYPGYTRQTFTADAVGRHVIGFEINGQMSNAVVVDVVAAESGAESVQQGFSQGPVGQSSSGKQADNPVEGAGFSSGVGSQASGQEQGSEETTPEHVDPGI
jgi:hypothetical protein